MPLNRIILLQLLPWYNNTKPRPSNKVKFRLSPVAALLQSQNLDHADKDVNEVQL